MGSKRKRSSSTSSGKTVKSKRSRKSYKKALKKRYKARYKSKLHQSGRARIEGHASGGTISTCRAMTGRKKSFLTKAMKLSNLETYNGAFATSYACPQGKQNAFILGYIYDQTDMVQIQTMMGKTVYTGNPAVIPTGNNWKWFLDNYKATYTVRNDSSNECFLEFYDCVPRFDLGTTVGTDPLSTWSSGNVDAGTGVFDYQVPGATPFNSQKFTTAWKVLKVTHVVVPAGSLHEHVVVAKPKCIFHAQESQLNGAYRNLTTYTMLVFRGAPCAIQGTSESTTSIIRLDTTQMYQNQFRWLDNVVSYNVVNNGLRNDGTVQFVNDETATLGPLQVA